MSKHIDLLLRLPGTAEEKTWLEERLKTLSAREKIVLPAAVERSPPSTMAEAVNHLLTLKYYKVCPAGSYEQLGEHYLQEADISQDQRPFFSKEALGQWYKDKCPGVFSGSWYVVYPDREIPVQYSGWESPQGVRRQDWSVCLKLAAEASPDGVWLRLPDYRGREEVMCALGALQTTELDACTLLEARCALPCVTDIAGQYAGRLSDLILDGEELGVILDWCRCEGGKTFDKFLTVLGYKGSCGICDVIDTFNELHEYEVVGTDDLIDRITEPLDKEAWAQHGEPVKGCFDYAAYAAALAEQQGYQMTDDKQYYIRKRDSPELEQQLSGMTMQ